jgi:hypothetical protein
MWIDAFREELSEFSGQARRLAHERVPANLARITKPLLAQIEEEDEDSRRADPFHENRQRMAQSYYALRLRLNPDETDHAAVLEQLDKVYKALSIASGATRREDCITGLDALAKVAQGVLKREWVRVKDGEPRFRQVTSMAKWVALALALLLASLVGYGVWVHKIAA